MSDDMLSERELKLVDGLDGLRDIRVYEANADQSKVLIILVLLKDKNRYCPLSSSRSVVKEFKYFHTLLAFLRKNCPRYVDKRIHNDLPVFEFRIIKPQSVVDQSLSMLEDADA